MQHRDPMVVHHTCGAPKVITLMKALGNASAAHGPHSVASEPPVEWPVHKIRRGSPPTPPWVMICKSMHFLGTQLGLVKIKAKQVQSTHVIGPVRAFRVEHASLSPTNLYQAGSVRPPRL